MNHCMKIQAPSETVEISPKKCLSARSLFWSGLLLCLLLGACATSHSGAPNRPGSGIAQYRALVVLSRDEIGQTLQVLDQLAAKPDRDSFGAFAQSVRRLEIDSISVRARSQAMEARGAAYFAEWAEHLTQMEDSAARKAAEQQRDELKGSFDRVMALAHEARQAFNAFLPDLRRLRATVETNPGPETVASGRELIAGAETSGHQVQEKLAAILAELDRLGLSESGRAPAASPASGSLSATQRQAQAAVYNQLRELYRATQNARNYGDEGVQLVSQQFQLLRKSYQDFTATLTADQSAARANEWAELDAGLEILQQAFDNYRQDINAGRTTATALSDLVLVLEQGGRVWLQNFNAAVQSLAQGPISNPSPLSESRPSP